MQVYPERFTQQLAQNQSQGPSPFYLIFGDEPQQKLTAIEQVRVLAKQHGFDERQNLFVDAQFSWQTLVEATQTLSLFSSKLYIEIEIPTGKPGAEGSKILTKLAEQTNSDTLIVLHGQKIGKDVQNTKWFKALDKQGIFVPCFPLEGKQLTQWVNRYAHEVGLQSNPEAINLVSDFCEGNLLAAKQEIDKLLLLFSGQRVTLEQAESSVVDQSRFNVFQLVDVMLSGDVQRMVKLLYRLEAEGIEPTIVLWALVREWQTLTLLANKQQSGQSINWNQLRIWKNRQAVYLNALQRLSMPHLQKIQRKLGILDQRIKQSVVTRPYIELCHLCMMFIPFELDGLPLESES